MLDGCKVIAIRANSQSVPIRFNEYRGMPHIFPMLPGLASLAQVQHSLRELAEFPRTCVEHSGPLEGFRGLCMEYATSNIRSLDIGSTNAIDFAEAKNGVQDGAFNMEENFQKQQKELRSRL